MKGSRPSMVMVQCQEAPIRNCGTSADRRHCGATSHDRLWSLAAAQLESNNLECDPYGDIQLTCNYGVNVVIIVCT